jgi:hypothetical protein
MIQRVLTGAGGLALTAAVLGACGTSPYYLPPPPTAEEKAEAAREAAADSAEPTVTDEERDLQARASLLKLYELLSAEQYEAAEAYLSQQTRDFLRDGSQAGDPSAALASGKMAFGDERTIEFEPVELLIGGNIARIEDAMEGVEESETPNRRELFVIDPQGEAHRVVMIFEGGEWVLQATSIRPDNDI